MRNDTDGAEAITGRIVFVATFILISSMLIAFMNESYAENAVGGDWEYSIGYATIGGITYDLLQPLAGYDLTTANVSDHWEIGGDENFFFYQTAIDDDDRIESALIRDNDYYLGTWSINEDTMYEDYFHFRIEYGWWTVKSAAISLDTVVANQLPGANVSVTDFSLGHRSYSFLVETGTDGDGFGPAVWSNLMNVSVGVNIEESLADNSMWSILGQILTFSLPEVHWIINTIVGVIFWTMIGVVAFTVVIMALHG